MIYYDWLSLGSPFGNSLWPACLLFTATLIVLGNSLGYYPSLRPGSNPASISHKGIVKTRVQAWNLIRLGRFLQRVPYNMAQLSTLSYV
jgi:hypothetical protein